MAAVNNHIEIEEKISELNINSKIVTAESSVLKSTHETNLNFTETDGKSEGMVNGSKITLPLGYTFTASKKDDEAYNMNHDRRGHCVIFNQREFDRHLGLGIRGGTDRDRDSARRLFKNLGFEVKVFDDLTKKEIENQLVNYAYNVNHSDCDCFVMVFMSHGESGLLFGKDDQFKAEKLFDHFTANECPSLAGKPKMFFIQACRGDMLDPGSQMVSGDSKDQIDSGSFSLYTIPNHADFLTCWSTVPGHFSWRNTTNGSWFIQSLVQVLSNFANSMDVLSMMTVVNRYMINNYQSNCPNNQDMHGKKQSASVVSTLTRLIYLKKKQ